MAFSGDFFTCDLKGCSMTDAELKSLKCLIQSMSKCNLFYNLYRSLLFGKCITYRERLLQFLFRNNLVLVVNN